MLKHSKSVLEKSLFCSLKKPILLHIFGCPTIFFIYSSKWPQRDVETEMIRVLEVSIFKPFVWFLFTEETGVPCQLIKIPPKPKNMKNIPHQVKLHIKLPSSGQKIWFDFLLMSEFRILPFRSKSMPPHVRKYIFLSHCHWWPWWW